MLLYTYHSNQAWHSYESKQREVEISGKILDKSPIIACRPQKLRILVRVLGVFHSLIVATFTGSTETPFSEIICPRNRTSSFQKWHLENFAFNQWLRRVRTTKSKCSLCSFFDLEKTRISSTNTRANLLRTSRKTRFIRSTKKAGALANPNDMTNHSKKPFSVWKAVLKMLSSATLSWWKPMAKSSWENTLAPLKLVKHVVDPRQRISILKGKLVQFSIINTPPQRTIRFCNKNHSCFLFRKTLSNQSFRM